MRTMVRNERTFWYCLQNDSSAAVDDDGWETGEPAITYGKPVKMRAVISAATGSSEIEQFGNLQDYDRVITTCDMNCPITETTVLYVDKVPAGVFPSDTLYPSDNLYPSDANAPDYIVKRVAKSINSIAYAISKVDVNADLN